MLLIKKTISVDICNVWEINANGLRFGLKILFRFILTDGSQNPKKNKCTYLSLHRNNYKVINISVIVRKNW